MTDRYRKSTDLLKRAEKSVPLASQTFSKSRTQLSPGSSPLFAEKGEGAYIWDADGNRYIDYVNALLPVVLGYRDPDVDAAIKDQLDKGIIFSLASVLETELAEKLVEIIPCAEMVRFGKNGSDATSGAIRLARAYTGRDHVACCGYHGWQDWYIGSTSMHNGVPKAVRELTHTFEYNNLDSLKKLFDEHPGKIACVIMEPMNVAEPEEGYLQEVADLARKNGALFILDEIITGFRFSLGGAQELFGVTPDLATFGKSMGNGMPISAVVGRAEIMRTMEEIFFSFTFGGEALSLAASLAVINKMEREPVIKTLWERGEALMQGFRELAADKGLEDAVGITGKPCWPVLKFTDTPAAGMWDMKSLFLQEMFRRGILTIGSFNVSYAHSQDDVRETLLACGEALDILGENRTTEEIRKRLEGEPLKPLFTVR